MLWLLVAGLMVGLLEFGQLVLNLSQNVRGGLLGLGADGFVDKSVRQLSVICLRGLIIFFTNF